MELIFRNFSKRKKRADETEDGEEGVVEEEGRVCEKEEEGRGDKWEKAGRGRRRRNDEESD